MRIQWNKGLPYNLQLDEKRCASDRKRGVDEEKMNVAVEQQIENEFSPEDIGKMKEHGVVLGSGSFGKVYKSTWLGTPVAIKYLKTERVKDLMDEIKNTKARPHPNVIQYLGACSRVETPSSESRSYRLAIVTELMDTDVEHLLADQSVHLSLYQRMKMALEAARGLAWLHGAFKDAILHRDFATKNLFVKKNGDSYTVKVADFGLARQIDGNTLVRNNPRKKGRPPGTPLTQAPEVMKGQRYGTRADVYSFGMVLWELLTMQALFEGWEDWCSYAEFVRTVTGGYRHKIPEGTPRRIRDLIERCWHPDYTKRPDMEEVVEQLQIILVEVAIRDEKGREFWRQNFVKEDFRDSIKWNEFITQLFRYFKLTLPNMKLVFPPSWIAYLNKDDWGLYGEMETLSIEPAGLNPRGEEIDKRHSQILGQDVVLEGLRNMSLEEARQDLVGSGGDLAPEVFSIRCLKGMIAQIQSDDAETVDISSFGDLLDWFGPMVDNRSVETMGNVLDRLREVCRQGWFHGKVDPVIASKLVAGTPAGTYLVRFSSQPGSFTLVIHGSGQGPPKHIRIERKRDGSFTVNDQMTSPSLIDVIHLVSKPLKLVESAPGSRFVGLFDDFPSGAPN